MMRAERGSRGELDSLVEQNKHTHLHEIADDLERLEMEGRRARFVLEKAVPGDRVRMEEVFFHPISANTEFARP